MKEPCHSVLIRCYNNLFAVRCIGVSRILTECPCPSVALVILFAVRCNNTIGVDYCPATSKA